MEMPNYAEIWAYYRRLNAGKNQYQNPKSAKSYDLSQKIWLDGYKRAEEFPFTQRDTVLDIGCGPGVLAIPLAPKVKTVTVVEPSKAMLDIVQEHCIEKNIQNIIPIHSTWEEFFPGGQEKFDYVIASYSLMMEDLREAILKMNQLATKRVYLFWFCGTTSWEQITLDLLPKIKGTLPGCHPKTDIIYGILCQLGISADVKHLEGTSFDREFFTKEDAIQDLRKRVGIDSGEYDTILETYLKESDIYQKEDEKWFYRDQTKYVCISWKPKK